MKYRVLGSPYSEERLEQLVKSAPDADVIAIAVRQIDQNLIASPNSFGESRYDNERIGFFRPLAVHFEVMDDVWTVVVYDVWRIDRKRS
jgi:hypothetical protein